MHADTTILLVLLMKSSGDYFHVRNYHCTNAIHRDLFERVTNTLKLMGIKHQIQKGIFKIRVLTDEQLQEFEALKTGTFSQRYGYRGSRKYCVVIDEVF